MLLPNGGQAIIDPRKLTEYSLNPVHEDGRHKAALLRDLVGVTAADCGMLIDALREAAQTAEANAGRNDRYGRRYIIDFDFAGPTGAARIRSAWIIRSGEDVPRLVTCYIL